MSLPLVRKPVGPNNGGEFDSLSTFKLGKNKVINGNFNFWQRGSVATLSASAGTQTQYLADRWRLISVPSGGTSATMFQSQNGFAVGQTDVPGEPAIAFRVENTTQGTSLGTLSNHALDQSIEDVRTLAGKKATLSFYAKSDISNKQIAVTLDQSFGSGGSSANNFFGRVITLTPNWTRYTFTFDVPSIAGKTLGSSHQLHLRFHFQAGSAEMALHTIATGALPWGGIGNTYLANVMLNEGEVAGDFELAGGTQIQEYALCMRYYEQMTTAFTVTGSVNPSWQSQFTYFFKVRKRIFPTVAFTYTNQNNAGLGASSVTANRDDSATIMVNANDGNLHYQSYQLNTLTADAEF